ncbi:MAG: SRPBCC family protein [Caldilineaceae bacterium]
MTTITNHTHILGPAAAVFDLVTTLRFWPAWHPATTGVGGVTQRPFQLGDKLLERAQIGARSHEGIWTVVAHERPHRATLRMGNGRLQISYTFTPNGNGVDFARTLEYQPADFAASIPDPDQLASYMFTQSEQALARLKALVEEILATESALTINLEQ